MTKKAWFFTALTLHFAAPVRADYLGFDAFSYVQENYAYRPEPFTVKDLKTFLSEKKPATLEAFLSELIVDRPAMGRSVVPLYQSHSLHRASFAHPRVILFGSPEMILSYGTDPEDPAFSRLEVLSFDPAAKRHSVHEVTFAPGRTPTVESPKSCATCHGTSPKPLWDSYNFWAGAYGLRQSMYPQYKEPRDVYYNAAQDALVEYESNFYYHRLQPREHERFAELWENWSKVPRLAPLKPGVTKGGDGRLSFEGSPQFTFSLILYSQRYRELVDRVVRAPYFPVFRSYFEKGLAGQRANIEFARVENLLSKDLLAKIPFTPDQVRTWVRRNRQRVLKERMVRAYLPFEGLAPTERELRGYARDFHDDRNGLEDFLFLVEAAGVSTADWSPNFGRDAYLFNSGVYETRDLLEGMRRALADLPPASGPAAELPVDYSARVASHFAEESIEKAERLSLARQPVMARCQYCHTEPHLYGRETKQAPFIPFHDSRAMAVRLKSPKFAAAMRHKISAKATDRERMPPSSMLPLSDAERESFGAYLDALSSFSKVD